jgi:hypothetical protein
MKNISKEINITLSKLLNRSLWISLTKSLNRLHWISIMNSLKNSLHNDKNYKKYI